MSGSDINKVNGASSSTTEAKPHGALLVELKNGKVYFKQKPFSLEKQSETLQEIVKFREMLEERIEKQSPPLTAIPEEHKPLLAKMAHESDKTLLTLSKHIHHELSPALDEDEERVVSYSSATAALPLGAVEAAIKAIMERNNYGLDGVAGARVPAALCVWRWEVKENHWDWLPKNAREKAEARLAERVQAKQDLLSIFQSLSQEDQDTLLDPKGAGKLPSKEINITSPSNFINLTSDDDKSPSKSLGNSQRKQVGDEENDVQSNDSTPKAMRMKKAMDPEKAAKEKEKLEKRAAKAEREKKEKDAQDKSRSLMANFFAKPKLSKQPPTKELEPTAAGPSKIQSEFEKSFKAFIPKKDTYVAPVNRFLEKKLKGRPITTLDNDIIVIDDDEACARGDGGMVNADIDVTQLATKDHLHTIISPLLSPANGWRPLKRTPNLKTHNPISVRDIVSQLSEAEIAGDISLVRSLLSTLCSRHLLPAKVFIFTEDARPGYFGTWTRNSRIIGPRSPFAKDVLVFDYSYDSGEEWEEEPAGEADDVVDDGEDEDLDGEDPDSDLDSWLVEDDEEPEIPMDDRDISPPLIPLSSQHQAPKRKAEESEKKLGKKRKVVIPLVPFAKGPCWESNIGRCDELLKPYRIQMFNDTPFPIDPFTFVSTCMEDRQLSTTNPTTSVNGIFAVPSLPDRLFTKPVTMNATFSAPPTSVTSTPAAGGQKKAILAPKNPFPEVHLPFLLDKITALQTQSLTFLVEAIYRDLREQKVKKNAIEAKVREVGEKSKETKFWVIKPGVQT